MIIKHVTHNKLYCLNWHQCAETLNFAWSWIFLNDPLHLSLHHNLCNTAPCQLLPSFQPGLNLCWQANITLWCYCYRLMMSQQEITSSWRISFTAALLSSAGGTAVRVSVVCWLYSNGGSGPLMLPLPSSARHAGQPETRNPSASPGTHLLKQTAPFCCAFVLHSHVPQGRSLGLINTW